MKFAFVFPGQGSQAVGMMAAYLTSAGLTKEMIEDAIKNPVYKMSDLKRDCKRLSEIVQMQAK